MLAISFLFMAEFSFLPLSIHYDFFFAICAVRYFSVDCVCIVFSLDSIYFVAYPFSLFKGTLRAEHDWAFVLPRSELTSSGLGGASESSRRVLPHFRK